jgi:hypothetical protein
MTTRNFIEFDAVSQSYGELASAITFTGDFEVELWFSTKVTSGINILLGNSQNSDSFIYVNGSTGTVVTRLPTSVGLISSSVVNDGGLHLLELKKTGSSYELFIDSVSQGSASGLSGNTIFDQVGKNAFGNYFDGRIANVKFTDITTPANSLTFPMDKTDFDTPYELPSENVFGSELVSNGDFSDGMADWYGFQSAVLSVVDNKLRVTNNHASQLGRAVIPLGSLSGNYLVTLDAPTGDSGGKYLYLTTSSAGSTTGAVGGIPNTTYSQATRLYSDLPTNNYYLVVGNQDSGIGVYSNWDNISVKEVSNALEYFNFSSSDIERYNIDASLGFVGQDLITQDVWENPQAISSTGWTFDNTSNTWTLDGDGSLQAMQPISPTNQPDMMLLDITTTTPLISGGLTVRQSGLFEQTMFEQGRYIFSIDKNDSGGYLDIKRRSGSVNATIEKPSLKELIPISFDFVPPSSSSSIINPIFKSMFKSIITNQIRESA